MPKTYRIIQQWNHWATHYVGKSIIEMEKKALSALASAHFGKNTILIGVPHQSALLTSTKMTYSFVLGPLLNRDKMINYIEGEFNHLPIQSGVIDQVILPHTLEFLDNPHHLLLEACRIVKPEGRIFILGFNPYSLWGLKQQVAKTKEIPWSNNFIHARKVRQWLQLADFVLEKQETILFRPPLKQSLYEHLKFLEWLGKKCYKPFGGIYILQAKAKVIPFTPIRLHWTQELPSMGIPSSSMPRPTIRNHS